MDSITVVVGWLAVGRNAHGVVEQISGIWTATWMDKNGPVNYLTPSTAENNRPTDRPTVNGLNGEHAHPANGKVKDAPTHSVTFSETLTLRNTQTLRNTRHSRKHSQALTPSLSDTHSASHNHTDALPQRRTTNTRY